MSNIPLAPEQRAKRWGFVAKWAAFAIAGFLFAPYVMLTITGMLGLLVAGAIAGLTWVTLPAIESGATNLRLKLIKSEAAKNPIETLENEYLRRQLLLGERKQAIETFDAKTHTFGDKLDGFKRKYPSESAKFQAQYDQMNLLLHRQRDQWIEANKGLNMFNNEIEKAKAMWDMALAAAAAQAGSGLTNEDFYAKLKVETALDSVQDGMNRSFSQLDTLLMEGDNDHPALENTAQAALPAPTHVVDINSAKHSIKVTS